MQDSEILIYIGSYTHGGKFIPSACGAGITAARFDPASGRLTRLSEFTDVENPSWLHAAKDARYLFAVSETFDRPGQVHSFIIAEDGYLALHSSQSSHGLATCHLTVTAEHLIAASYLDGRMTIYPLAEGQIEPCIHDHSYTCTGPNPERQEGSHAHQAMVCPRGRWLYICDLGGDRVHRHDLMAEGRPLRESIELPAGAGPRHLVFHPQLPIMYVFCELHPLLLAFDWEPDSGVMSIRQTVDLNTLPELNQVGGGAAIHIHPSAQLLGVSERAGSSVCLFRISDDGTLSFSQRVVSNSQVPRDFAFSPDGRWLLTAYQESHQVAIHRLNADFTADSEPTHVFAVNSPVRLCFVER